MSSVNAQIVTVYRGEAAVIPASPTTDTSVATMALVIYISTYIGAVPTITLTESDGITITTEATGDFTVTISRARTLALPLDRYYFELWDLTGNERLAGGTLLVEPSSRPTS